MGRVYDALRRAEANKPYVSAPPQTHDFTRRDEQAGTFVPPEVRAHRIVPSAKQIEEELYSMSSISSRATDAVKSSAFTAHTADVSDGTALPNGTASRDAGATLNAARPARARGFVSYDIVAARVEPQQAVGESSGANYEAVYQAIQQGRTYSPIPQWAEIENTYKGRFGNILDEAAKGQYSEENVQKRLDVAAKEADGLLAQSTG